MGGSARCDFPCTAQLPLGALSRTPPPPTIPHACTQITEKASALEAEGNRWAAEAARLASRRADLQGSMEAVWVASSAYLRQLREGHLRARAEAAVQFETEMGELEARYQQVRQWGHGGRGVD